MYKNQRAIAAFPLHTSRGSAPGNRNFFTYEAPNATRHENAHAVTRSYRFGRLRSIAHIDGERWTSGASSAACGCTSFEGPEHSNETEPEYEHRCYGVQLDKEKHRMRGTYNGLPSSFVVGTPTMPQNSERSGSGGRHKYNPLQGPFSLRGGSEDCKTTISSERWRQ